MTYEEFLNIPVSVYDDLETILLLKQKHFMDITTQEIEIWEHMERFAQEQDKSTDLRMQKRKLEELFRK
jgi:hypothetical protein